MSILRAKHSQKREFEENLLQSMDSMYNLAYRLTKNSDDAKDLVQEASMRAFRFFHKFEKGTNFKGWILTIERNLFINNYRKKIKEPVKIDFDEYQGMIGSTELNGAQEEIFGETVQVALDQLPEELQTVVILFYVEGFSYKEISKIMGTPIGTVMSRLYAAKNNLKKMVDIKVYREAT